MSKINLVGFLQLQKIMGFDFLLALKKDTDDGKCHKIPIAGTNDFVNPLTKVHKTAVIQKAIANPESVGYPFVGIILKKDEGLKIAGKQLVVIDIDCKGNPKRGDSLYKEVKDYLVEKLKVAGSHEEIDAVSEKTVSGGYHIFLCSDQVYPRKVMHIEENVEIEVYSHNRFMVVAPSEGYSTLTENDCVNFLSSANITLSSMDLNHFIEYFDKSKKNKSGQSNPDLEINPDFIFDQKNWLKATKDWEEMDAFMGGKRDRDWDGISSKQSSYDYVRFNIMPVMALFSRQDIFLNRISEYGKNYMAQWREYPDKWLEDFDEGTIILGSDARKILKKVGLLKTIKKANMSLQDLIEDFVNIHMVKLFSHVLVMHGAIYYYNESFKCYVYLDSEVFRLTVGVYYSKNLVHTLKPIDYQTLKETFKIYAKIFAHDKDKDTYIHYNLLRDKIYKKIIPIVFKNGTLYLKDGEKDFKKGEFDPYDRALYSIQCDYDKALFEEDKTSIILDWFKTKFDKKAVDFIRMFLGNLLVPAYSPSVMLVLYSYKGAMGKSTLATALSNIFNAAADSSVISFPLTNLADRFGGSDLSKALLNITTELDGRIDSEAFKKVVSREKWRVEAKFAEAEYEIPIAKHICFANDIPKISVDGGVGRRLAIFELIDAMARPDIEPSEYEHLFIDDSKALITFMLQGLLMLQDKKFCDLSSYYKANYKENVDTLRNFNSNVHEWLSLEGIGLVKKSTDSSKGIKKEDLYIMYKTWCENEQLKIFTRRTFSKYVLSNENITEKRPTTEDGNRPRLISYKKT